MTLAQAHGGVKVKNTLKRIGNALKPKGSVQVSV
jgi:hypothetical protein